MPTPSALLNEAMAAAARKDYARAVDLLSAVLRTTPDAALYFNRAVMLQQLGQHKEAVSDYDAALRLHPDDPGALFNRAAAYDALNRREEALSDYTRLLQLRPNDLAARNNRGGALAALGRHDEALADFEHAMRQEPRDPRAHYNAGTALRALERHGEALAAFDRVLALNPNHANAWNNRGLTLEALDRAADAVASIDQALARGRTPERLVNRGSALLAQNRHEEAIAAYDAALALNPNDADARYSRGGVLLALGRFDEGWRAYEERWNIKAPVTMPALQSPRWLGDQDIAGRSILLQAEQGFGDTVQFARYAALLTARGAHVLLRVQPALKALFREGLAGGAAIFGHDDPPPVADFHTPLLSTPLALRTRIDTIPGPSAYLSAAPERVAAWRATLGDGPLIGLAWRGELRSAYHRRRTIPLETLTPLFSAAPKDARFVSLQMDANAAEQEILAHHDVAHFGEKLRDFREHAALTAVCDLVLTIDTVIAHLAGALGRAAWIMLPYAPDWRWLIDREDSPWYPQARLFRQTSPSDWQGVVARVAAQLRER